MSNKIPLERDEYERLLRIERLYNLILKKTRKKGISLLNNANETGAASGKTSTQTRSRPSQQRKKIKKDSPKGKKRFTFETDVTVKKSSKTPWKKKKASLFKELTKS